MENKEKLCVYCSDPVVSKFHNKCYRCQYYSAVRNKEDENEDELYIVQEGDDK